MIKQWVNETGAMLWCMGSNALIGGEQCFGECGAMSTRNKLSEFV